MPTITGELLIGIITVAVSLVGTLLVARNQGKKNSADAVTASVAAATDMIRVQQARITQLHADIKAASDENADYTVKLKAATERLDIAEEQLNEVKEHLTKARNMIALLNYDLDAMKKENLELRERVRELETQRIQWAAERERMKCEIDKLAQELKSYKETQG